MCQKFDLGLRRPPTAISPAPDVLSFVEFPMDFSPLLLLFFVGIYQFALHLYLQLCAIWLLVNLSVCCFLK
jgi:hypothetical protein